MLTVWLDSTLSPNPKEDRPWHPIEALDLGGAEDFLPAKQSLLFIRESHQILQV